MRTTCRATLARMLLAMLKLIFALMKAIAIIVICVILMWISFPLWVKVGLYAFGYSDGALYSVGKECVINTIGVDRINEEVTIVFADNGWEKRSDLTYYEVPDSSCLYKLSCELPSPGAWHRTLYRGSKALVLRFGCHYNYVWLVIVDPTDRVFDNDNEIMRIGDNIGVCFDTGKIGY